MSGNEGTVSKDAGVGPSMWCRQNVHFLIAAAILAMAAGLWVLAPDLLEVTLVKKPINWPDAVSVSEDFRLVSLPKRLGHYEMIEGGEIKHNEDILATLGIGTSFDKTRYKDRCSNWYVSRIYRDTRKDSPGNIELWQVDVTYYTGGMDKVPHVPERCLVAGGATLLGNDNVTFNVPLAREPWDRPIVVRRTKYAVSSKLSLQPTTFVQYYVFSLNGRPVSAWERVRAEFIKPWIRYCYFAKIQIVPRASVTNIDIEKVDRYAEEFANDILPSVLQALPMPRDIERLSTASVSER